jgi:hypothetical protein
MTPSERVFKLRVIVGELELISASITDPASQQLLELICKYLKEMANDTSG